MIYFGQENPKMTHETELSLEVSLRANEEFRARSGEVADQLELLWIEKSEPDSFAKIYALRETGDPIAITTSNILVIMASSRLRAQYRMPVEVEILIEATFVAGKPKELQEQFLSAYRTGIVNLPSSK